jgi:hypothetical protein
MIEPAMTTPARRFCDHFHEEPVDVNADPFASVAMNPCRDPLDTNQAIPTLLLASLPAQTIPTERARSVEWSLIPGALGGSMLALERRVPLPVRMHLAFPVIVVLERV